MKFLFLLLAISLISSSSSSSSFKYRARDKWTLKSFYLFGQIFSIEEQVGVSDGAAYNRIALRTGDGEKYFGFSDVKAPISKTITKEENFMRATYTEFPIMSLNLKASGSINYSVKESTGKLVMTLNGSIILSACDVKIIYDEVSSINVSAKGTIVNINSIVSIDSSNYITKKIKASGGNVSINIQAKLKNGEMLNKEVTLWSGWSK